MSKVGRDKITNHNVNHDLRELLLYTKEISVSQKNVSLVTSFYF
jgi:hypothetical protein